MNVIVCIKQVPDTETNVHIQSDGSGIEEDNIHWVLNPYDEFALEEALQLREKVEKQTNQVLEKGEEGKKIDFKIKAVTVGSLRCREILLKALAMGVDEALLIQTDMSLDNQSTAKILFQALNEEQAQSPIDMIFTGTLSIDDCASSVPQMLAEFLDLPHVTNVSKFDFFLGRKGPESHKSLLEKDIDQGKKMILEVKGPCVLAANKGLNVPRNINMMSMIKAKKKPLKLKSIEEMESLDGEIKVQWSNFKKPFKKSEVKMVEAKSAEEKVKNLVRHLKDEAKLL